MAADRTSEPFMHFGIYCHILYYVIFGPDNIGTLDVWFKLRLINIKAFYF